MCEFSGLTCINLEYLPEYCAASRVPVSRAEEMAQLAQHPWCKHEDLNPTSGTSCKKPEMLMCTWSWKRKEIKGTRTLLVYQKASQLQGSRALGLSASKADLMSEPWVPVRDPVSKKNKKVGSWG